MKKNISIIVFSFFAVKSCFSQACIVEEYIFKDLRAVMKFYGIFLESDSIHVSGRHVVHDLYYADSGRFVARGIGTYYDKFYVDYEGYENDWCAEFGDSLHVSSVVGDSDLKQVRFEGKYITYEYYINKNELIDSVFRYKHGEDETVTRVVFFYDDMQRLLRSDIAFADWKNTSPPEPLKPVFCRKFYYKNQDEVIIETEGLNIPPTSSYPYPKSVAVFRRKASGKIRVLYSGGTPKMREVWKVYSSE